MSETIHTLIREIDHWWWVIAGGSVLLAITVVVLARLRMIQSRPIRACIVLSVFAHLLLLGSAHLLRLFDVPSFPGDNAIQLQLTLDEETVEPAEPVEPQQLEEDVASDTPLRIAQADLKLAPQRLDEVPSVEPDLPEPPLELQPPEPDPQPDIDSPPAAPPLELAPPEANANITQEPEPELEPASAPDPIPPPPDPTATPSEEGPNESPQAAEPPSAQVAPEVAAPIDRLQPVDPAPELEALRRQSKPTPRYIRPPKAAADVTNPPPKPDRKWQAAKPTPPRYQLRNEARRLEIAKRRGGTKNSEQAVEAALKWLVKNQQPDGRWSAARHGAGRGNIVDGQHRHTTGMQADTGVSGLALLAMLGGGHTHERGSYKKSVQQGLEYLMSQQRSDGCLGGGAGTFAQMYCHGIATLALCEACAMTRDQRLDPFTRRAVEYTLRSQHRTTGGWRYYPGDPGDTSQFGWQLMVVESAPQAGIRLPPQTRSQCRQFLSRVSTGARGGLASYRPGQPPTVSMTAEALACRVLLGNVDPGLASEATRLIMSHPPRRERRNLYYWYYATLALYQLDSAHWPSWNEALQRALIPTQRKRGRLAGSWDTDTMWGGCGGRVYTTSMAALCLEVYYRYLPIYGHELARRDQD